MKGTARKVDPLIEQSLKNSEIRYRRLFEASQEGILILDAGTGMIEDVNPFLVKMLGYSREEFLKKRLWEVGAFKDIEASKEAFEVLQEKEYIRYEDLPLKTKDGRLIQVEFVSSVYLVSDEKVIQCNIRDITEHRRLIVALQDNEKTYRDLINQSPDGYFIIELSGNILTVNKAMCRELEFSEEELLSMNIWDIIPNQYLDQYRKRLTKILEGRSLLEEVAEYEVHGKNGKIHYVEVLSAPHYSGKDIVGFQGVARDVTARKQAEAALIESEERFRTWTENSSDLITVVGLDGAIQYESSSIEHLLGYKPEELIGTNAFDVMHPDDRQRVMEIFAQNTQKAGNATSAEFRLRRSDGSWRVFEGMGKAYLNEQGQMTGLINSRDITDRKQAETEILQRLNELEMLYQGGLAFSRLKTPKAIAEKVIALLDQKMDWHHTAIRLYHPESEIFELLAFHLPNQNGREEHSATEEQLKSMQWADQGISGWVIQHDQVVRTSDLKNDPRYFETFPGLQSGLYVPIKINERVIGVISIESEQPQAFNESDERLVITLIGQAAIAMDNLTLFDDLQRSNSELMLAYETTLEGWSHALDLRDKETEGHTQRVTEMTVKLARAFGLSEADLVNVRRGGLLHDIGKMGVPDNILLKPGELTKEEWQQMRMHPVYAYDLLSHIAYLHEALDIPYCHHEKWDGSGYPRGLKDDEIPLVARIFAVVDVWDALISERPYRAAWTKEKALEHIRASAGTHFDPHVVSAFMQILN
jgi:PAS domain S-box-containing protein